MVGQGRVMTMKQWTYDAVSPIRPGPGPGHGTVEVRERPPLVITKLLILPAKTFYCHRFALK